MMYPYRWAWRSRLSDYYGQPCRVLIRSKRGVYPGNSVLLEFEDGYKVVTSANGIRRRKDDTPCLHISTQTRPQTRPHTSHGMRFAAI